ncbi:hypothetical protein, partial [Burkholderia orbicola]|uniref:hypothetical protein n=1 Tax=Burkholderia orbicola TaxID=2978683 RepID=UPI002FE3A90C
LGFRFARHKFSLGACYALNTKFLTGPNRAVYRPLAPSSLRSADRSIPTNSDFTSLARDPPYFQLTEFAALPREKNAGRKHIVVTKNQSSNDRSLKGGTQKKCLAADI